jgi:hypothetical protein
MPVLRPLWNAWRAFGRWMADAVGRAVMFVLYFTVVAPFGLAVRLFSDPLQMKPHDPHWQARAAESPTLADSGQAF